MIFKILGIRKDFKDARNDPAGFMTEELFDVIKGVLFIWKVVLFAPLIILGIFSFSTLWGGPYVWVRWVFFIWLILWIVIVVIIRFVIRLVKRKTHDVADSVITRVRESVQFTEHDSNGKQ